MNYGNYFDYTNYFRDTYNMTFTGKDVLNHQKYFYTQWKFINSKIKIAKTDGTLEIGSGIGGFYSFLNCIPHKSYTGLELDNKAVTFCKSYFNKKNSFIHTSFEDFKSSQKYNKIFAFEVLEHFLDPIGAIKKIYSLLDTEGIFIGNSPPPTLGYINEPSHIYCLKPRNWQRLFNYAGFKTVNVYPYSLIPYLWRINKHLNPIIPLQVDIHNVVTDCMIIAQK